MIGLVDCNNFFVSCERLFRPDLIKKPVAVLSSNDGCIVARSEEVKRVGIPMGAPYFQIKDICRKEKITLFSSNFPLYRDISRRVMTVLQDEVSFIEIYSVDEAFFEYRDSRDLYDIRNRIIQKTGIPISIGVGRTKTLAKIASKVAKKSTGVCCITDELWRTLRKETTCGSVWGIGAQLQIKLNTLGIITVHDLLNADKALIKNVFGVVGERLRYELQGQPVYNFSKGDPEEVQSSYTSTRSFGTKTHDKTVVMSALAYHVANVAEKLRKDATNAASLTVVAQGSRHGDYALRKGTASVLLSEPTNNTRTLTKEVMKLFETLFDPEIPYTKAGVVLGSISPEEMRTTSLFETEEIHRGGDSIDHVIDMLNTKMGTQTIRLAVTLGDMLWKEKTLLRSKRYTTTWSEIPHVGAIS